MYLGIDLGTSNSAIVGNDNGRLRHFKTVDDKDVLPSAIMLDRRGGLLVGQRAYEQAAFSPENVGVRFKRLMGTSSSVRFASTGREMSPEEASAEILKALVAQARMAAGDFEIDGAVITVPAAFNQMQSEATMSAAKAAGLDRVALLQEPIAAALASIALSENKNGQFLVYDLGGGTFDAAIVQSLSGSATVIAHAGINMLGGSDFDRALLNSIVRPWLLENFDLPEDFQKEKQFEKMLRVARYRAEIAKIALSTQVADRIFADEGQIRTSDRSGEEIYLDIEITREQLEGLIGEEIDRSIALCQKLFDENGYKAEDFDRVVLIGGPSRMPIVRERIGNDLGVRVDLEVDPMTAVAHGAAIFAESRDWSGETASLKNLRGKAQSKGLIDVRYDFPARTSDDRLRIRVSAPSAPDGVRIEATTEDGWSSGQLSLKGMNEIRGIPLAKAGPNRVSISVYDSDGSLRRDASTELVVVRTGASAAGMPMTHSLAVKIAEGAFGSERNRLSVLVDKGTILPESGAKKFRCSKDLYAGDGGVVDFEVYEVAEGVADPDVSKLVGAIRVNSSDLERGQVVRRGDEVLVEWTVDENGLLRCELQIPAISATFGGDKMYVSSVGHQNFDAEEGLQLASAALIEAGQDVDQLERGLGPQVGEIVGKLRIHLAKLKEQLTLAYDADTRRGIAEEALLIRQEVARTKNRPELIREAVRHDISDLVTEMAEVWSADVSPEARSKVLRLLDAGRDTLNSQNPRAPQDAERFLSEAKGVLLQELAKSPGFWVARHEYFSELRHMALNKKLHDDLVNEGFAAISKNDLDALKNVCFRLHRNLIKVADPTRAGKLSGLME
jgi:molecular chaperone DnaK